MIKYRIAFLGKAHIFYWDNTKKEWAYPLYATTTADYEKAMELLEEVRKANPWQGEKIIIDSYIEKE